MHTLKIIIDKVVPFQYRLLLISCLLIILSGIFSIETRWHDWATSTAISINLVAGLVLMKDQMTIRAHIIKIIGLICIPLQFLGLVSEMSAVLQLYPILYIVFFIALSIRLYKDIYIAKEITVEILAALFCGFIILGILTAFIFTLTEGMEQGSFSGIPENQARFDNMLYFSFSMLLTFGFGDIVAKTKAAKILVILIGLIGYFYTVVASAIIIGKYLASTRKTK